MTGRDFRGRLSRRARRAGVALSPDLTKGLEIYYRLLASWNRKINLTGMDLSVPSNEAFDRLLIEPLVAAGHCDSSVSRMLDVGSGGGSPAIPMALALVGTRLVMVEPKVRKSVFLVEATRELGLARAEVVNARVEELLTKPAMHEAEDLVTIRAVRLDTRLLVTLQALLKPNGWMFLFRGPGNQTHESVGPQFTWLATYPLLESLRSRLIVLQKVPVSLT